MAARLAPLALAAIALGGPPAAAIPWDAGGAIPPARTPPPARANPFCRQSYADDGPRGGLALRFGIGPRLAGESGAAQTGRVVPENARARDAALLRLAGRRSFTVRLNRLFSGDGAPGIARFRRQARHFARLGLDVELQVRYHPRPAQDGDSARGCASCGKPSAPSGRSAA